MTAAETYERIKQAIAAARATCDAASDKMVYDSMCKMIFTTTGNGLECVTDINRSTLSMDQDNANGTFFAFSRTALPLALDALEDSAERWFGLYRWALPEIQRYEMDLATAALAAILDRLKEIEK